MANTANHIAFAKSFTTDLKAFLGKYDKKYHEVIIFCLDKIRNDMRQNIRETKRSQTN